MKRTLKFLAVIILTLGCTSEPIQIGTEFSKLPTPKISDLTRNNNFHYQKIELTGYYFSEFEMSGLFERKENQTDKAIWVNFSEELREQLTDEQFQKLIGRKLRVQGTYNAKSRGHLMQYIGTIDADFIQTLN